MNFNQKLKISFLYFCFIFFIASFLLAQAHDPKINANDKNLPEWVKLMYSENPVVWEVNKAYEEYYKTNPFVKNTYTQYYKRWIQNVENYVQSDGRVKYLTPTEITQKENLALKSRKIGSLQKPNGLMYWEFIGPEEVFNLKGEDARGQFQVSWHANVYGVDIAKSNTNILYCGTESGGLYKTTDKGLNWFLVNSNLLSTNGIRGLKIHPTNPDVVYANISKKIYKTENGGITWSPQGDLVFQELDIWLHDIHINPQDPEIVYLASNKGFFRSTNGGSSWTKVIDNETWSVDIKPNDPNIIYIACKDGSSSKIFKSTDKGATFTAKTNGWYNEVMTGHFIYGVRITVTEDDPNRIYAIIGAEGKTLNGYAGVFMSTDAGETWTHPHGTIGPPYNFNTHPNLMAHNGVNGFYQGLYDFAIIANPLNADEIIIGGTSWWASDDGAKTYKPIGGYVGGSWAHPDMQFLRVIGNELWIANDGGLNYSTDFMRSHVARNKGISGHEFWGFGAGWNQDVLVGGRYHDGNAAHYETYPAKKFLRMGGGEASTGYVNYKDGTKTYFSDIGGQNLPNTFNGDRTTFNVSKWPSEKYFTLESSEMEFHPHNWNIFYIGSESGLWITTDNGTSFTLVKDFGTYNVRVFEICRANPDVIYVLVAKGWNSQLWKTNNSGKDWEQLTNSPINFTAKASIAVSAENTNEIWIANYWDGVNDAGKKVWKSDDGGKNWTNLSTPKLNGFKICDIMHQYGTDGGIYLGTDLGNIFYKNNNISDWISVNSSLPVSATTLKIKPFYKKGKIRNCTRNYGIWESDFFEQSRPVAQMAVNKFISTADEETFQFVSHSVQNDEGAGWLWKFPGGTPDSSTLQNPTVTYSKPGSYNVTLIVTDKNGKDTSTVEDFVTMYSNEEPVTNSENSLTLENDNDYAVSGTDLNLTVNNFTITGWIKRNGNQNDKAGLIYTGGSGTETGLLITSANELRYNLKGTGSVLASKHIVPDNEWTHIAMVVELNKISVYMNGKPKYFNVSTGSFININSPLYIGTNPFVQNATFRGKIDEVSFYDRALKYDEIRKTMYLSKNPNTDSTLITYYKFNEDEGNVYDYSGKVFLKLNGNAKRVISDIPVGEGLSEANTINNAGEKIFSDVGVKLVFPEESTLPNGQVVISKIKKKNFTDSINVFRDYLWFINNYGSNKEFSSPTEITFFGLDSVVNTNDYYNLYQNPINSISEWKNKITAASSIGDSSILFSTNLNLTTSSSLLIDNRKLTDVKDFSVIPNEYSLEQSFPNPFNPSAKIKFTLPVKSFVTIKIFDHLGREVTTLLSKNMASGKHMVIFNAKNLASGTYYYQMRAGNFSKTKRMILLK